jgi:hypothetical protein
LSPFFFCGRKCFPFVLDIAVIICGEDAGNMALTMGLYHPKYCVHYFSSLFLTTREHTGTASPR